MKKNTFLGGAIIASLGIILVKIIGILYVIPFNAFIGEKGGALYGYGYNMYTLFLSMSSAGFPFAVSKLTSQYIALNNPNIVSKIYKVSRNIIFALSFIMFSILFIFATYIAKVIAVSGTNGNTISDIILVIRIVSFAILVVPFLSVTKGFLQGHKFITPSSMSQILEQLVRVFVILLGCYLSLNVFKLGLTTAVGISVFAATIGGIVALIYLQIKLHKSNLLIKKSSNKNNISSKIIIKQLFKYAIPFVIISVIFNLYETIDMILVQRTMSDILHIDSATTEAVSSVFTIWGGKFNGIVLALVIGLTTSLTPNLVASYTKGDIKDVNKKINTSLEYVLFITVPLTIFISCMAEPLWTLFYGSSKVGPDVYKFFVFYALFGGVFTVLVNILQNLNKYKEVIFSIVIGLLFNAIFDVPFILLFSKLGLVPAGGAIVCGLIGYSISISYSILVLRKQYNIDFSELCKNIQRYLKSWLIFLFTLIIIVLFVPLNLTNRIIQLPILGLSGLICFGIYIILNYKNDSIKQLLNFCFKRGVKYEKSIKKNNKKID